MDEVTPPVAFGETPVATDPQTPATGAPGNGETPAPTTEELQKERDDLKAALRKANAESASHRHKAKELDELKAQIEADKLSESEKAQKKIADLQALYDTTAKQLQERTASYEVRLMATQMSIVDPDVAVHLIRDQIEYDDGGTPTNVKDLLENLVKLKPYLAGRPGAVLSSGGTTNPARSQTSSPQALSWEYIGRMTPQEYATRSAEVQQWLSSNPRR